MAFDNMAFPQVSFSTLGGFYVANKASITKSFQMQIYEYFVN